MLGKIWSIILNNLELILWVVFVKEIFRISINTIHRYRKTENWRLYIKSREYRIKQNNYTKNQKESLNQVNNRSV